MLREICLAVKYTIEKCNRIFIDYDIKSNETITEEEQKEKLEERRREFSDNSSDLIEIIHKRLDSGNQKFYLIQMV